MPISLSSFAAANLQSGPQGVQGATGSQGSIGSQGNQGALSPWSRKTSNYNAVDGDRIIADTTGGTFTITLPSSPIVGAYVVITDGGNFYTTNLTVARNGSTIEGLSTDLLLDIAGTTYELIYDGNTWELTANAGVQGVQGGIGNQGVQGAEASGNLDGGAPDSNYGAIDSINGGSP